MRYQSRPRQTTTERMSEWVLHCAISQRHIRRSQPTREAALKDACSQLREGYAVNRIVGYHRRASEGIGAQSIDFHQRRSIQIKYSSRASAHLSDISVAARARTAIVINITAMAGMCVRKSTISLHRYGSRRAENRTPQLRACSPRKGGVCDLRVERRRRNNADDLEA